MLVVLCGSFAGKQAWSGSSSLPAMLRTRDFLGVGQPTDDAENEAVEAEADEVDDSGFADFVIGQHVGRMPRCGRSTINSNFSPKDLADAVIGWTDEELNVIRQMGLSGLLHVDRFTHFNRDFSFFLMQCIDTENDRLVLGRNRFVRLSEASFCRIVGARVGGDVRIERTEGSPTPWEIYGASSAIGILGDTEITTLELVHVLRSPRERPLTTADARRLEVAYAMLAISVFFSPREKRWYVPRDAYRVAMRPSVIRVLNWGKYGREEFLDGAWMIQDAIRRNTKRTLFGCLIVGQIMYFDNVNTGDMAMDPDLEPRLEQYTASVLKALIFRDTLVLPSEKVYGMFRGVVSRASLMMNAPFAQVRRRRPCASRNLGIAPQADRPLDSIDVASLNGVHRHQIPTVEAILQNGKGEAPSGEYAAVYDRASVWLRGGYADLEGQSRVREARFYSGMSMNDVAAPQKIEAFERRERVIAMLGVRYLLQQLVSGGVGNYIPGVVKHLDRMNEILIDVPAAGVPPIPVADFLSPSSAEGTGIFEGVDHISHTCMRRVQRHATPTIGSILHTAEDDTSRAHTAAQEEYDAVVKKAKAWLRDGFTEVARKSKICEDNFYLTFNADGARAQKIAEDFYRREKIIRLQGVQYLLNHLSERGVGKWVPSLDRHLGSINSVLAGIPAAGGQVIDVSEFILTTLSEDVVLLGEFANGGSSNTTQGVHRSVASVVADPDRARCPATAPTFTGSLDLVDQACMRGVHRHQVPTIDAILQSGPGNHGGNHPTNRPQYDELLTKSREWLEIGFAKVDSKSKYREEIFYQKLNVGDKYTEQKVEEFDRREKIFKLQCVQYLVNHLSGYGVGKWIPSIEQHSDVMSTLLAGLPRVGGRVIDVADFPGVLNNPVGLSGSSSLHGGNIYSVHPGNQVLNPMPLRCVPMFSGHVNNVGILSAAVTQLASAREVGVDDVRAVMTTTSAIVNSVRLDDDNNHPPLNFLATTALSLAADDVHDDGASVKTPTSYVDYIPNAIGQNTADRDMIGTGGSSSSQDVQRGGRSQQRKRSMRSILRGDESLEYIVYRATRRRGNIVQSTESADGDRAPVGVLTAENPETAAVVMPEVPAVVALAVNVAAGAEGREVIMAEAREGSVGGDAVIATAPASESSNGGEAVVGIVNLGEPLGLISSVGAIVDPLSGGGGLVHQDYGAVHYEPNYVLVMRKKVVNNVLGVCPHAYNFSFGLPNRARADLGYTGLMMCLQEYMPKLWVIHRVPKLLKMSGFDMLAEFHKFGPLGRKGFEIVRRMVLSVMNSWYSVDDRSRFMHCMPTSWMKIIAEGGDHSANLALREMFLGLDIDYDIETCHLLWLPRETDEGTCVLYGLDLDLQKVHVMDPMLTCSGRAVLQHTDGEMRDRIIDGFIACAHAFFDGWSFDRADWGVHYHEYLNSPSSEADSIWYVVYYIMNYDGRKLLKMPGRNTLITLRTQVMMMVLNMVGNEGEAPEDVKNHED